MLCFMDDLAIVRLDSSSTQKSVAPICVMHICVLPKNKYTSNARVKCFMGWGSHFCLLLLVFPTLHVAFILV